ncbi:MAG: DUF2817 domain-containing protein [Solirubrobacterales bacterium]
MRRVGSALAVALLVVITGALAGGPAGVRASGDRSAGPGSWTQTGRTVLLGHSVRGRAIRALRLGDPESPRKALVVGAIHGDEPAGMGVVRELRRRWARLRGMDLWTVYTVNPDGVARGTRRNARGVDLNRNFSFRWHGGVPRASGYYPGPRPFSEPETRLVRRLLRRLRPRISIWYHQPWGQVLAPCPGFDAHLERRYSRISDVPLKRCRGEHLPGTAVKWTEHHLRGADAFVVELPAGRLGPAAARRNARAAVATMRAAF